ncbi:MAG: hypothetical protein AB1671_26300 [Thermodesulfobacteriota bacterium]|jgi:hypothetical protein
MPSRNETEEYWTPERLRKATPLPLPTVKTPPCPATADEDPSAVEAAPPVGAGGQAPEEIR